MHVNLSYMYLNSFSKIGAFAQYNKWGISCWQVGVQNGNFEGLQDCETLVSKFQDRDLSFFNNSEPETLSAEIPR